MENNVLWEISSVENNFLWNKIVFVEEIVVCGKDLFVENFCGENVFVEKFLCGQLFFCGNTHRIDPHRLCFVCSWREGFRPVCPNGGLTMIPL